MKVNIYLKNDWNTLKWTFNILGEECADLGIKQRFHDMMIRKRKRKGEEG